MIGPGRIQEMRRVWERYDSTGSFARRQRVDSRQHEKVRLRLRLNVDDSTFIGAAQEVPKTLPGPFSCRAVSRLVILGDLTARRETHDPRPGCTEDFRKLSVCST